MAPDPPSPPTRSDVSDHTPVEDILSEFLLEREEGRHPSIDDYLARYPKHAEILAKLLSDDTASPATLRRTTSRDPGAPGSGPPSCQDGANAIRLGPYDVIEHVSTAGGGTVYRARHREAGHLVALKVLDSRGAVDPRDIERFHREAAMLRALNLVHVVPVLDAGEEGGRNWIAMKWLEGDTFSKLREAASDKSHRLYDLRERARLVARVARTFAAIHAYGILHRDVKPSNIMVDRTGEPMIIDFGIAQAPDLPELTATTDQLMGTPRFLAPELLSGGNRQVSPRTDVYGLGLCLYELCTGTEAFKQELRADLFTAIRTTGPTHPRKANPALSHDFAAVILRAIEIDPMRRYPDMAALADDLDRIARGESPEPATLRGAHPILRAIRRNKKRLIAAACLVAVLVPAIWLSTRSALEGIRARDSEKVLRPFAWFSPEAFAGGLGVPSKWIAGELAENKAATPEQRLVAAWIPFLSGSMDDARAHLGTNDLPGEGFAARLFRAHLLDLKKAQSEGHQPIVFLDRETSRPAVNPRTGEAYEAFVPTDNREGVVTRDIARFDESVLKISRASPPSTPVDRLVLANLSWSLVSNDPRIDTTARRTAIERELASAVGADATRVPALHLRGVMRFLAGDLAAARRDLEAVFDAQPAAVGSRYVLGIVCTRSGDPKRGCEMLETVERGLPPSHPSRPQILGHIAMARAAAGQFEKGLEACQRWWTECEKDEVWQNAVIPRVIAAHLCRDHGDLMSARNLLVAAIQEEERIKLLQQERNERGSGEAPGPIALWKPAFQDLLAVAEALHDQDMAEEYRAKMETVVLVEMPKSAEAYLDRNLGGLRPPDPSSSRILVPLPRELPRNQ